jgi:hypothetical protein
VGRESDKGHGLGGPNVERQVFGVLLTFFVVLFAFSGLSARCLLSAPSSLIVLLHFNWTVGSVRKGHSRGEAVKRELQHRRFHHQAFL